MSEANEPNPADAAEEFVAVDDSELDAGKKPKGEVGEGVSKLKDKDKKNDK